MAKPLKVNPNKQDNSMLGSIRTVFYTNASLHHCSVSFSGQQSSHRDWARNRVSGPEKLKGDYEKIKKKKINTVKRRTISSSRLANSISSWGDPRGFLRRSIMAAVCSFILCSSSRILNSLKMRKCPKYFFNCKKTFKGGKMVKSLRHTHWSTH